MAPTPRGPATTRIVDRARWTLTAQIFALCHLVRFKIREAVDSALSGDQMRTPAFELSTIRPLLASLTRTTHPALIWALLLCRLRFLDEADEEIAFQNLYTARASVCEVLAIRALSSYSNRPLHLVSVLTMCDGEWRGRR